MDLSFGVHSRENSTEYTNLQHFAIMRVNVLAETLIPHPIVFPEPPVEVGPHSPERAGRHPGPCIPHIFPIPEQEMRKRGGHAEVCSEKLDYPCAGVERLEEKDIRPSKQRQ